MTLEERKLLAAAFMERQYNACIYELNLKPSEVINVTINVLAKQPAFKNRFKIVDIFSEETRYCPFMREII